MTKKNGNNQYTAKRWEYKDGRMLTARAIWELHPELGLETIKGRLVAHKGDWDYTLRPKRTVHKLRFDVTDLAPRKNVEDITSPSDYEKELWGH